MREQLDAVPADLDKREGGIIMTALGPASYALAEAYNYLNMLQYQSFALTSAGEALDMKVAESGIYRKQAAYAVRTGVFNIDVPLGARFSTPNGSRSVNFRVFQYMSTGVFQMIAETAGTIGNEYTGPVIQITFVNGLNSAIITDILIPGTDTESDESLRARYIERLNERPFGGNIADYRQNILAIPGVGEVEVYPVWNGGGTVKCSIVDSDFDPASPALIQVVQDIINPFLTIDDFEGSPLGLGTAPIGAQVTIAAPTPLTIGVSAAITLTYGMTIDQVEGLITDAIDNYLLSVRKNWGTPADRATNTYILYIFRAQIIAAILDVDGVINVTDLMLNGADNDITITQTGQLQRIPVLGTVVLNGA